MKSYFVYYIYIYILPGRFTSSTQSSLHLEVLQAWNCDNNEPPPSGSDASHQSVWDSPRVQSCLSSLLDKASSDPISSARLLAATKKESGAWLTAPPPTSSLGLRMDDETIRTAVGVRLGVALCNPHSCQPCGEVVDELGLHGLSCRKSKGRIPRHTAPNQLVKQSLASVHIPSTLEPRGLCSCNECRPDGVTIIPWSQGKCIAWDGKCHDSFATTNMPLTHTGTGLLANRAAEGKRDTYSELATMFTLIPIAIETTGVYGDDALLF